MKKINKININGESYDIQDNSSGYITGEEVDKFLPKGYVITTKVNTKENQETASKIWEDIKNGKPVEVWYQWSTNEYRRMIGYRFLGTSYQLDMYFERDSFTTTYTKDEVDLTGTYAVEITYMHSDNIYNRVLLLDNRQAFLIKNSAVNIATRNYVDTKFAEALAMGFKVEVVEALPTENISHQVIYLVLNGDDEENNIYDEFVYNSNDEWEKIGSTKTDLSNYYNKQEVDELVAPIQDYEIVPINVFASYSSDEKEQETLNRCSYLVNKVYEAILNDRNTDPIYIPYVTWHNTYFSGGAFTPKLITNLNSVNLPKTIVFRGSNGVTKYESGSDDYSTIYELHITGTWTDNVFTATDVNTYGSSEKTITTANTKKYFPRQNEYNPVTRKYVEESNLYNWGANNIALWLFYEQYTTGQIVYQTDNLKYYKCLEDHEASYRFSSDTAKWQELTEEELEALKTPTKQYVDETVANIDAVSIFKICENEAFNKQSSENTYDKFTLIGDFVEEFSVKINELLNANKNGYVLFNGRVDFRPKVFVIYVNLEFIKKNTTITFYSQVVDNRSKSLIGTLQISISYNYDNETNQISNVSSGSSNYIEWAKVMTNISKHEFTPTNDYHVANKIYVDNAISTALGDVNSILATLTTVEESEVSE